MPGTFEERGVDRRVDLDVADVAFPELLAAGKRRRRERHLHAVDRAVVGESLFDDRLAGPGDERLLGDEPRVGIDGESTMGSRPLPESSSA